MRSTAPLRSLHEELGDAMIRFELTPQILGSTSFACSPLTETTLSLHVLQTATSAHPHAGWLREARERLDRCDRALLMAVAPRSKWVPSFLVPHPATSHVSMADQLTTLSEVPVAEIERDLRQAWSAGAMPAALRALLAAGDRAPAVLAEAIEEYWDIVIRPSWERIRGMLEDDIAYRTSAILDHGLFALLHGLHPTARVQGTALLIDKPHHAGYVYEGDRLILVPSLFVWPKLIVDDGRGGPLGLTYAARGVGRTWGQNERAAASNGARLAALIGRSRALVLECADFPVSTTQLARRLGRSLSSINEHLTLLRRAGLLERYRSGRCVMYRQTELAQSIIAAAHEPTSSGSVSREEQRLLR